MPYSTRAIFIPEDWVAVLMQTDGIKRREAIRRLADMVVDEGISGISDLIYDRQLGAGLLSEEDKPQG